MDVFTSFIREVIGNDDYIPMTDLIQNGDGYNT